MTATVYLPPPTWREILGACSLLFLASLLFVAMTAPVRDPTRVDRDGVPFAVPATFERYLAESMPGLSQPTGPWAEPAGRLLLVVFRRPDVARFFGDFALGLLIWLAPFSALLIGRLHATRWGHRPSLTAALVFWGISTSFLPDVLAALAIAVAFAVIISVLFAQGQDRPERRRVLLVLCLFSLTSGLAAGTTHRFCAVYRWRAPMMFVDDTHMRSLASSIRERISLAAPDELLAEIVSLPGLDKLTYPTNLFARIKWTTCACLIAGLLYLLSFVVTAKESRRPVGRVYMLVWPLSFYLALGAVFALHFYAMYICEAARQNTLWVYARVLQKTDHDFQRLRREFDRYGWSRRLERDLVGLRKLTANDPKSSGKILEAVLAEYWASVVIAQDRPSVSIGSGSTEQGLSSSATIMDMFYFSFASFTTTGYGDIRPVSDEARVWAIVENIAELLFTAMFFGIIVDWPHRSSRLLSKLLKLYRDRSLPVRRLPLVTIVMLLYGCTTKELANEPPAFDPCCRLESTVMKAPVQVIVDDSKSMAGFIRADARQFRDVVERTLEELASAGSIQVRRLSNPGKVLGKYRNIGAREFYGDDRTPLTGAFDAVTRSPTAPFVIVSDLQQDEDDRSFDSVADALRGALETHPYVFIAGQKLPWIGPRVAKLNRPLFIVIMASTLDQARSIESYIRVESRSYQGSGVDGISMIRPKGPFLFRSRPFMTVERVDAEVVGVEGWQNYASDPPQSACPRGPAITFSSLVYLRQEAPLPLHFRIDATTFMPVHSIEKISVTLCKESCSGTSSRPPCEEVAPARGGRSAEVLPSSTHDNTNLTESNPLNFEVEYRFPLNAGFASARYHAEFRLGEGNVMPPPWIDEWTTIDPSDPERTLHLRGIVDTVIRAIAEKEVFLLHDIELRARVLP